MTRLLASVKSLPEARLALACGADIIDLKDPEAGVLGALPLNTVASVVEMVGGRCTVSATVGDLPMEPTALVNAVKEVAAGVDYVKVGFFPGGDSRACIYALSPHARQARLVAVLFADCNPDFSLLEDLAQADFAGVMLDTIEKSGGGLRYYCSEPRLADFIRLSRAVGLMTGLAGSLRLEDVPELIKLGPDYLGFRGALCAGTERNRGLDSSRVSALRNAIPCLSAETIRAAP